MSKMKNKLNQFNCGHIYACMNILQVISSLLATGAAAGICNDKSNAETICTCST